MVNLCSTCGTGWCKRRVYDTKCFGKKPLLTVSIVVIVIMCLSIAEAAPRPPGHKKRHNRKNDTELLNELGWRSAKKTTELHNIRHYARFNQRLQNMQTSTKQRKANTPYKNATLLVTRKLKNVSKYFTKGLRDLNMTKKFRTGNPRWLPKVNFVAINENTMALNNVEARFKFVIPKLHQNLMKFKRLFELLLDVKLKPSGDHFYQIKKREEFIKQTKTNIESTISDLLDSLAAVNMNVITPPSFINTSDFLTLVGDSGMDTQDQIAFRGFENTIKNWISEFKCWTPRYKAECNDYKKMLIERKRRVKRKQ